MLDRIRRGQRWLTGLFIAVIGGVFVFFLGIGGGGPITGPVSGADTVVSLDDIQMSLRDYERVREQQYARLAESIGQGLQPEMAEQFASQQALRSLVETAILASSASELGLAAGKREIQEILRADPSLRDAEGRFDRENFEDLVEYRFGSQRLFLETMRIDLLRQKMVQILVSQAYVSDGEARSASAQRLQEVELAAVLLDTKNLPAGEELSDEIVESYASENEPNLKALYDEDPTQFGHSARAKARHILIEVPADADEPAVNAARNRILAVKTRLQETDDTFEELAKQISDDEGTKDTGGDLGWFERSEVDPAIASAAFGLEPGETSDAVRSLRGFHLVALEEKRDAGIDAFEEVRLDLARRQAVANRANERARKLANELKEAVEGSVNLEDAARARELTLVRTGRFRRRADGVIPQIGASAELMAAAFSSETTTSFPKIWSLDDQLVLAQLVARHEPTSEELDADVAITQERLVNQRRERIIRAWIDDREQELNEQGRLFVNRAVLSPT